MAKGPSVDFHIGAHKTATTFIQRVMYQNEDLIRASGISVPHHRQVRKFVSVPSQLKGYQRAGQDWKTKYTDAELAIIMRNFYQSLYDENTRRILISDENLTGHCGHLAKSGVLYNRKKLFLGIVKEFFPQQPKRIIFGIRSYKTYFSSVYGQYLLDVEPENMVPPEVTVENVMKRHPNWANFTKTVQQIFPEAQIVIYPFEGMGKHWNAIFGSMLTPDLAQKINLELPRTDEVRLSMSGRSYLVFKERLEVDGMRLALDAIREIRDTYDTDASAGKMNIFNKEQSAELDRRYKRHLEELSTLGDNVKVLYEANI